MLSSLFFIDRINPLVQAIENSYKIKLKMQKLELSSDSLAIISDVKLNLRRFIKYKEKRCKWNLTHEEISTTCIKISKVSWKSVIHLFIFFTVIKLIFFQTPKMTQKPVNMGPPKIRQGSKKLKRSWRKNIDITEVEEFLGMISQYN